MRGRAAAATEGDTIRARAGRRSGDFVNRERVGDAAQQALALRRRRAAFRQQLRGPGMIDNGPGRVDRLRSARPCTREAMLTVCPK